MSEILLTQDKVALVDSSDHEWLSQFKWCAHKDHGTYYAVRSTPRDLITKKQTWLQMHRVILGLYDSKILVDHQNGNGLDNRRSNLRIADSSKNQFNQGIHSNNTSGFKGVTWSKRSSKWRAYIRIAGKQVHLGLFDDLADAALAYDLAALHHGGEFAQLNYDMKGGEILE